MHVILNLYERLIADGDVGAAKSKSSEAETSGNGQKPWRGCIDDVRVAARGTTSKRRRDVCGLQLSQDNV